MWLLLVPVVLLIALVFALGSLAAGLFWIFTAGWPWLLIGLGAWMLLHQDGRHRRHRSRGHQAVEAAHQVPVADSGAARPERKASRKSAPRPLRPAELPIDLQVKVEQIRRKVEVLLGYADRFPPFSRDLYLVRQTANDYLPRTIKAYLAMSVETAEKPIGTTGQTAHQELKAQLDLLDARLDDIAQDLERQDTDRLLANRRFLEDRFGMREVNAVQPDAAAGVA
jgi:hypothetical protein